MNAVRASRERRVLLVIDSLGSGGAQRQLVTLAAGLARSGYDVSLFNYYPQYDHFRSEVEAAGVSIIDVEKRSRFDFLPVHRLRRAIDETAAGTVIAFLDTPNVYALFASIGKDVRVIVSERSAFVGGSPSGAKRLKYQVYRWADHLVVNSYHQADNIREHFTWSERLLAVVWNGIDLDVFRPRSVSGEDRKPLQLLGVGTVQPGKNVRGAIGALDLAVKQGVDVSIAWAGKVIESATSRNEYEPCCQMIKEQGLESHWTWLGECGDMPGLYGHYDALIHPSFFEGLPNAICEALACGVPVLAGNVCDHGRLVQDSVTGKLFNPQDVQDIARALTDFAAVSGEERQRMGELARDFAQNNLSIGGFVQAYRSLIDAVHGEKS